ncbi:MAG: tetratricopeptide repeat protein [Ottowia sp.]|nr:tetratricopeptide repeat protein [Ottowia sp.]
MTLPLQPLDADLFARAQALLDDEWLAKDAELAPVLPVVLARGVGQDWHKAGTFRHHLVGVARSLALWQQPRDVRLLGLLHSVYGNAFVDLVKFDASTERVRLQQMIGQEAEELVYLFCTASRREFVQKILAGDVQADGSMPLHTNAGQPITLSPYVVAAFTIVSMADTIEQWFSWQDDIYSRFPATNDHRPQAVHWMASLWPGPMRPSGRMLHQINQLGLALQHPALKDLLPMPPVFGHCSQALSAADDAAAASLYWSVIQQDQPLVDLDVATGVMEHAVRLNPWVGEPQMVLAQLYLSAARRDEAAAVARSALQCFAGWGNAWDKRVQWDAWVAWTRILLQGATAQDSGAWPARLDKLNNVALKPETVA